VPVANKAEPRSGDLAPRVIPSDTGLDGGGESFHPDATSGPLGERLSGRRDEVPTRAG